MSAYHRTQILLEPEQHHSLAKIAATDGRSLSDLFREMATAYLQEHDEERKQRKALEALARLSAFRAKTIKRANGETIPTSVDLLNEMREERMLDFERIWRDEA